jgi:hypothetical protein
MTFAFQRRGEYIVCARDLPYNGHELSRKPSHYGIPAAQGLATCLPRVRTPVGVPTLVAAESLPVVDYWLHILRDRATTLLARVCEAQRHGNSRDNPSVRIPTGLGTIL